MIQDLSIPNPNDDIIENGNDSRRILRIQDKDKNTLVLLAPSVSDCNLWLKEIDNARRAYNIMKSPMLNRPKSSKYSVVIFAFNYYVLFLNVTVRFFLICITCLLNCIPPIFYNFCMLYRLTF